MAQMKQSQNVYERVKNLKAEATDKEIRYVSLNCALNLVDFELARGRNNATLADEMGKLADYTHTIEKLLKMQ